jgi:hypothetical protein
MYSQSNREDHAVSDTVITERHGFLVPTPQQLTERAKQQQGLDKIAASALTKLQAQHQAGTGYQPADFDAYATALGLDTTTRIAVKRTIERTGQPVELVLAKMKLIPDAARIEAECVKNEGERLARIEAKAADLTKLVAPHAKGLLDLADGMEAAGIGLGTPGVHHFRRVASEMMASAALGKLPHTLGYDPDTGRWAG